MVQGRVSASKLRPGLRPAACKAADGLVVGGREVWIVVARPDDDLASLLHEDPLETGGDPLRLCRAILDGGILVLGEVDPETDTLLSDLLRGSGVGQS